MHGHLCKDDTNMRAVDKKVHGVAGGNQEGAARQVLQEQAAANASIHGRPSNILSTRCVVLIRMSMALQVAVKMVLQDEHVKNKQPHMPYSMDLYVENCTTCVVLMRFAMAMQVAIKKVLQDKRFENRQLQITQRMDV